MLLVKGASLSLTTPRGDTALHLLLWHASRGDFGETGEHEISVVMAMITKGADLFVFNDQGLPSHVPFDIRTYCINRPHLSLFRRCVSLVPDRHVLFPGPLRCHCSVRSVVDTQIDRFVDNPCPLYATPPWSRPRRLQILSTARCVRGP